MRRPNGHDIRVRGITVLFLASWSLCCGCGIQNERQHPTDAALLAYFHEHRTDLDLLRENDQASARLEPGTVDSKASWEWQRLIQKLGLPGGGWIESANRIFIPVNSRLLGRDSVDIKGFAWIDSIGLRRANVDTLPDLDELNPRARESAGRHLRPIERSWYLYRWIGPRVRSED